MIAEAIEKVRARIAEACSRAGRSPNTITLMAVTKGRSIKEVQEAISCGVTEIGESRVQEAVKKYEFFESSESDLHWHLVGHLQTNKVKEAVGIFDLIHSVDSLRLACEIERQAAKINKLQQILIEIKTSPEPTKQGIPAQELKPFLEGLAGFTHIKVRGLMTIAPLVSSAQQTRPYFRAVRLLADEINSQGVYPRLEILSMGMSSDFEVAIEEGATLIRLGRVIFEG